MAIAVDVAGQEVAIDDRNYTSGVELAGVPNERAAQRRQLDRCKRATWRIPAKEFERITRRRREVSERDLQSTVQHHIPAGDKCPILSAARGSRQAEGQYA